MLKIIERSEKVKVLQGSVCDKCKTDISQIEFLGVDSEIKSILDQEFVDISKPDGLHLTYVAGYGTELDGTVMSITLCTHCINELIMANGGETKQNRY